MYVGGSVIEPGHYSAVRGLARAADKVAQATKDIADATMHASERKDAVVIAGDECTLYRMYLNHSSCSETLCALDPVTAVISLENNADHVV